MEHLHYSHLGQVIRAIADVLIITGILPNGAIAGHLSTNSSDSVAPLSISFKASLSWGFIGECHGQVSRSVTLCINNNDNNGASENKQPKSHIGNVFIGPIRPGRSHASVKQYFEVIAQLLCRYVFLKRGKTLQNTREGLTCAKWR